MNHNNLVGLDHKLVGLEENKHFAVQPGCLPLGSFFETNMKSNCSSVDGSLHGWIIRSVDGSMRGPIRLSMRGSIGRIDDFSTGSVDCPIESFIATYWDGDAHAGGLEDISDKNEADDGAMCKGLLTDPSDI